jgi:hypothetical protein
MSSKSNLNSINISVQKASVLIMYEFCLYIKAIVNSQLLFNKYFKNLIYLVLIAELRNQEFTKKMII